METQMRQNKNYLIQDHINNDTYTGTLKKTTLLRSNEYEYEFDNLIKLVIIRTSDQTVINDRIQINEPKIFRTGDYFELLHEDRGKRKSRKRKSRKRKSIKRKSRKSV